MSSTTATGPTTTSATSVSELFPTVTASSVGSPASGTNPTVYYFVFLGVLLVLLGAAGCLAYRAYRLRRRYRTARQLAIARGEPIPDVRDDYWGLGGLSAWTSDGVDRLAQNPDPEGPIVVGGGRGKGKKGRWEKIPVLADYGVEDEKPASRGLTDAQPITLHSLLEAPKEPFSDWATAPPPTGPRQNRFRTRMSQTMDIYGPGSLLSSRRNHRASRNMETMSPPPPPPKPEMRAPQVGENVRVAVVIKMPRAPTDAQTKSTNTDEDEDEEVGWEPGMELAIWEGTVGAVEVEEPHTSRWGRRRSSAGGGNSPKVGLMRIASGPWRSKSRDNGDKGSPATQHV